MESVAVFGGTGRTGKCAVARALQRGLGVTVLAHQQLPEFDPAVKVLRGDVTCPQDVLQTLRGASAAVVALGTRDSLQPSTVMSEGLRNVLEAMPEAGVPVVSVCLSSFLFLPAEEVPPRFRYVDADHRRMLSLLQSCGRDYVAVLPPHIVDTPPVEVVLTHGRHPGLRTVSSHSLGAFLVDCLDRPHHYGKTVGIADKAPP